MKNKKGWIKIVEAFVAILIITGALLIVINKGYIGDNTKSDIYEKELSILREIQLNDTLRESILSVLSVPIGWDDTNFPPNVKSKLNNDIPTKLECEARICNLNETCFLSSPKEQDVYSKSVAITATTEKYKQLQLKLFCWEKN